MQTLILERTYDELKTTGSIKLFDGSYIHSLERPYRGNQVGISCIPEGEYEVHRDFHGRHTWFSIKNVPDRTFIEIHEGHKVQHSQGCILFDIIDLQNLLLETQGKPFKLIIKEA